MKQSDSPSTLRTYWGELDQTNTDNSPTYYDTPEYVVDVLGGAVSDTYRRLPESKITDNVGGGYSNYTRSTNNQGFGCYRVSHQDCSENFRRSFDLPNGLNGN